MMRVEENCEKVFLLTLQTSFAYFAKIFSLETRNFWFNWILMAFERHWISIQKSFHIRKFIELDYLIIKFCSFSLVYQKQANCKSKELLTRICFALKFAKKDRLLLFLNKTLFFFAGCHVFAYDHTIKRLPYANNSHRIHWKPIGLGVQNGEKLKTLGTLIDKNGHTNRTINYLKVSIPH